MRTTRVPEVIDRLVELLTQRTDPEATQVLDGPTVSGNYKDLVFLIGYRPDQQQDVTVTRTAPNGLTHHDREVFEIGVLINAVDGTGNVKSARDKAAAGLAILEGILTEKDMGLGLGSDVQVRLSDQTWRSIPTTKGVEQTVACVVVGQAAL